MFNRFDQSSSRRNWLTRNNYPARAFGVGLGFNRDYGFGRGGFGRGGFGRGGYGLSRGLFGRSNRFGWGRGRGYRGCNDFVSFGLGYGLGRFSNFRRSRYYRCNSYPYFGYNNFRYSNFGYLGSGWGGYYGFTSAVPAYYGFDYPVYASPGAPVYVDVDNYNYTDPNAYGAGGSESYNLDPNAVGVVPSTPNTQAHTMSHRELAEAAFYRGEYDLARRELVRAMLADPDDAELQVFYAYAHFATADYVTAVNAIRRALQADPSLVNQPLDIAAYYSTAIDFENQFERLERTIAANPYDSDFLFLAGYVQYAAGNAQLAFEILKRAEDRAPTDLYILLLRDASNRAFNLQNSSNSQQINSQPGANQSNSSHPINTVDGNRLVVSQYEEFIPEVRPTYPVESD